MVVDGQEQKKYTQVWPLSFGPDSKRLSDLRQTAPKARDAVYAGDFQALGRSMIENTDAQGRLHGELIVHLTQILGVSADEILGLKTLKARNGGVQNRRLLRQVQALEKLPKRDQQAVIRTIEAFLAKAG